MRPSLMAVAIAMSVSCSSPRAELDPDHAAALQDSVLGLVNRIPPALADGGPRAWLRFFEAGSGFFMASDGQLVFPTPDSARAFVEALSTTVSAIGLQWIEPRITPLAPGLAAIATAYTEEITDTAGASTAFGGYMTGVARHGVDGWHLQHLHWSSPVPPRH